MPSRVWLYGAVLLVGCSTPPEPAAQACLRLFRARLEPAEIVRIKTDPDRSHVQIAYRGGRPPGAAVRGTFACRLRRAESGGFRIESATLDGKRLVPQWALVVNADLVLDELGHHGSREPQS